MLAQRHDALDVAQAARSTARIVRMHRSIKTAARRMRMPQSKFPHLVETDYASHLADIVHAQRSAVAPLIAALPGLLASAASSRTDAVDEGQVTEFAGFPVVIENKRGSTREWTDADGTTGSTVMKFDYGYIDGVIGADGEEVDVYLGPSPSADWVYVVHQMRKPEFAEMDEQKVMLGFPSPESASDAYLSQYDDPRFFGGMDTMSVDDFRRALAAVDDGGGIIANRMDAGEGARARHLIDAARVKLESTVQPSRIDAVARKYGVQASEAQRAQLRRQTKAQLGIDVPTIDRHVPAMIEHYVAENVSLIKTLGSNTMNKIEKMVTRSLSTGARHEELAQDIMDEFDVSERHARLIARDQVGKLYGQITTERHQELGVRKFRWVDAGDDRVRDTHVEFARQSASEPFSYDDPPVEDGEPVLPGEPICCRCSADPVFDDILDAIEEE